jgi:type II secretory pathway component PulF
MCKPEPARRAFLRAADDVENGASFDDALHTLSVALSFPEQAILSAGWQAGRIEPAIRSVVTRRDVMHKTRREVRSKLILPAILLFVASFVAPLPGYILGMINGGGITGTQYLIQALTPIAVVVGGFLFVRGMQRKIARQYAGRGLDGPPPPAMPWDYPMLKVPVLAMVQRWRNLSEFASLMADLLGAGLGTLNSLKVCAKALPNGVYRNHVLKVQRRVEAEGISIAEALPRSDLWPMDWVESLRVGHETGEEETVCRRLGEHGRERYLNAVRAAGTAFGWLAYGGVSLYLIYQIFSLAVPAARQMNDMMDGLF